MGAEDAAVITTTPISHSANTSFSNKKTYESMRYSLVTDWQRYSRSGLSFEKVLDHIFGPLCKTPFSHQSTTQDLVEKLIRALSSPVERKRYQPLAKIANDILCQHYTSNPPVEGQSRVLFVPLGDTIVAGKAVRRPDIVVVLRDEWEEEVKDDIDNTRSESLEDLMEAKPRCQKYQTTDQKASLKNRLATIRKPSFPVDQMTEDDLALLNVQPSWRIVVTVVELKVGEDLAEPASPRTPTSKRPSRQQSRQPTSSRELRSQPGRHFTRETSIDNGDTDEPAVRRALSNLVTDDRRTRSKSSSHSTSRSSPKGALPASHPQADNDRRLLIPVPSPSARTPPLSPASPYIPKTLPPQVQLLGYCNEIGKEGRECVTGVLVDDSQMRLISCDREGVIESSSVNLGTEDGAHTFAQWVTAVGTQPASARRTLVEQLQATDGSSTGGWRFERITLKQKPSSMSGRSTTIFAVRINRGVKGTETKEAICKVSWQPCTRTNEVSHINRARTLQAAQPHLPEMLASWTVEIDPPSRALLTNCLGHSGRLERREMRAMIMSACYPLDGLTGEKFLKVFKQIMRCYTDLYEAKLVQHRDVSLNNMMYRFEGDEEVGVLNDWDLARILDDEPTGPTSGHRSGTPPFMARDLQDPTSVDQTQTMWHDLESGLYVLLFVALGYKGDRNPKEDPLKDWRRGDPSTVVDKKQVFISRPTKREPLLQKVREEYEPLKVPIRQLTDLFNELDFHKRKSHSKMSPITVQDFFDCLDGKR